MNKDGLIFSIGLLVTLIIISTSSFLFYESKKIDNSKVNLEDPVVLATLSPTATPQNDYKNMPIKVLNGSGIAGKAKAFSDSLEKLGYKNVETGNNSEQVNGNFLMAPIDFGIEIELKSYKYQKSDDIKIILGK